MRTYLILKEKLPVEAIAAITFTNKAANQMKRRVAEKAAELARRVTSELAMPTIGIGAGPHCDGQVLVSYDAFGLFQGFVPRFVKRYADLGAAVTQATRAYIDEVRNGMFPSSEHSIVSGPAGDIVPE